MIIIRKSKIEDLQTIQNFNNKLCTKENNDFDSTVNPMFSTTNSGKKYFVDSIERSDKLTLIVEDNDKPIGYATGSIETVCDFRNIPNMCEIDNMWVNEKYRNQNIGAQLINKIEIWAKEKNVKRMRVIASYKNKKGIKFYKKEGFSEYDLILEKDL